MDSIDKSDPVVISLENVTMDFKIATGTESGLKNYLVQGIKGKISHRTLRALDGINLSVKKGEIVGIIGSNGSGKSTLLKLLTGVLYPTAGQVNVDFAGVRLLTLGSGFDMEMTGAENVYLNGSILGYSRKYLEEHYAAIVEFAELEGFMDEKVLKYSSGMVQRLAFSIATAGLSSDILLLDEVLSVGDIFFRKKCLQRINEMMHSGTTVILVSHDIDSIREFCSRVIWIERGSIMKDGAPEEVCDAYENQ